MKVALIALMAANALGPGAPATFAQSAQPVAADVAEGRRLFHQKCSLCHVAGTIGEQPYGPKLSKAQVDRSEEGVKHIIRGGMLRMPGFQYTLEARQIAAIVAFLRTLDTPPDRIVVRTPAP